MGLLDKDPTPWTPPKCAHAPKQTALSQDARDEELNNFGRKEEIEGYEQPNN